MTPAFYVSYAALWALVVTMAVLVLLLYRHFGVMAMGTLDGIQRDGLAVNADAEPVTIVDAAGDAVRWSPVRGRPTLLLFASTTCEPCLEILPYVRGLAESARAKDVPLDVVTISPGPIEEAQAMAEQFGDAIAGYAEDGAGAFAAWKVRGTPFGFVVDEYGKVASKGLCNTPVRLIDLVSAGGLTTIAQLLEDAVVTVDRAKLPLVSASEVAR